MKDPSTFQEIINRLKFGSGNEKIEATLYTRRKADDFFVELIFGDEKKTKILRKINSIEPFTKEEKEEIKSVLIELISAKKDILACWLASVVLTEYGSINKDTLDLLWTLSNYLMEWLLDESDRFGISGAGLRLIVQEETMRALSQFKDIPSVGEKILECYEAQTALGKAQGGLRQESLYAFGTIGNEKYRDLVQYNADQGEETIKNAGKAALELWGKGTYDEIKKLAENKTKKGPCFIATEIYCSPYAPEVLILKNYRDIYLSRTSLGRWLINKYYAISPRCVNILRISKILKYFVRIFIFDPIIKKIRTKLERQGGIIKRIKIGSSGK